MAQHSHAPRFSESCITTPVELQDLCDHLRSHRQVAVDTEFLGEDRFTPRLELVQLAAPDCSVVVDVPAVETLKPLTDLLSDPAIEKVFHAGRQDLELLVAYTETFPAPIFDTQIAAALLGYGAQVAYAHLVEHLIGTSLEKGHTYTDWGQRPLSTDQLAYALDDVRYLLPIHHILEEELASRGRRSWAEEEFARLRSKCREREQPGFLHHQRVKGWQALKPPVLAILQELAVWREEVARLRNRPRGSVLRDEVLIEIARRKPASLEALRTIRGMPRHEVDRNGETLLAVIQRGRNRPPEAWPVAPGARKRRTAEDQGIVDVLQGVLKSCAQKAEVAPTLVATTADLQALASAGANRESASLLLLQGWRRTVAGDTLLHVLNGRLSARVDPHHCELRLEEIP